MNKNNKTLVVGSKGMVGSAIVRRLNANGFTQVIQTDRSKLDLLIQADVEKYLTNEKFDQIYIASAKVGGIHANNEYPADFLYENLTIQSNLIHGAFKAGTKKLLFLGSSCIYPKHSQQPMPESELLTGILEPTNEAYAIAKIAGIKMCQYYNKQYDTDYRAIMPTNLYGPGDNYDLNNSHVIPGLVRKFHQAKLDSSANVMIWGTGKPRREFMHVDDMASACLFLMNLGKLEYRGSLSDGQAHINAGSGEEVSILELANILKETIEFNGEIILDRTKPDGTMRKLLDNSILFDLGWKPTVGLKSGLKSTYTNFIENFDNLRQK